MNSIGNIIYGYTYWHVDDYGYTAQHYDVIYKRHISPTDLDHYAHDAYVDR